MQLSETDLEELNVIVKMKGYSLLLEMVESVIDTHVDDVNTIEELYTAKGQNEIYEFLGNLETLLEQAHAL